MWYGSTSSDSLSRNTGNRRVSEEVGSNEVLCVEDNAVERAILSRLLRKQGFRVSVEVSGDSALSMLEKRHKDREPFPSVLVMDLFMPGTSGIDTARQLRQLYPLAAMPIIFLSGEGDQATISSALDSGGSDYIMKPFKEEDLLARIRVQVHMLEFWHSKMRLARDSKLLGEILPAPVIQRLHSGQRRIADELEEVTVLFSDIVGFTSLASSVPTADVISMLDTLFSSFDRLTDSHGVYKVETIGDAYMVVAGLDGGSRANHAERAIGMAADMIAVAGAVTMPNGAPLQIRVGLHSGPAYAGVVGSKRPRFCLFGDTVNVASRMESTSFPQCIHLSDATRACYERQVAGAGGLRFRDLGMRSIKGKGEMHTWLVCAGRWADVDVPPGGGACEEGAGGKGGLRWAECDSSGASTPVRCGSPMLSSLDGVRPTGAAFRDLSPMSSESDWRIPAVDVATLR